MFALITLVLGERKYGAFSEMRVIKIMATISCNQRLSYPKESESVYLIILSMKRARFMRIFLLNAAAATRVTWKAFRTG
jgi:hypothetical protein